MKLSGKILAAAGTLLFALALASPAHAQLQACSVVCPNNSCSLPCINDSGQVVTCLQVNDGCVDGCDSRTCTPQTFCSQTCRTNSGTISTCEAANFTCCPGTLTTRTFICKAQFYKAATGVCVLIKRFDDVYSCPGSTKEIFADDFTHKTPTDAASCPSICGSGCEDLCR
jgi:hypothetical protein